MIEYFLHSLHTGPLQSPEVLEILIQDHMLLCCYCRVTNIFINHYLNTSPLRQLNIWAFLSATKATKKCGTRPAVHQDATWWSSSSCWSPSNLMITITCSHSEAPHSLWFVSNWSVPFAWLIWLLHFSLSPVLWLLWHFRYRVSLIASIIGLEMLHASLFWGEGGSLLWAAKPHGAIWVSLLLKINEPHRCSRLWWRFQEDRNSRTTGCWYCWRSSGNSVHSYM